MAGAIGGVVGGLFGGGGMMGGLASSLLGSVGGMFNNLVEKFGFGDVLQGVTNSVSGLLGNGISALVDNSPLPDFMKDAVKSMISSVVSQQQQEVPCDCQEAVDNDLGSTLEDLVQAIMDFVKETMEEEANEESGGADGSGGGTSVSSGNWMMMLAKALGEVNGQHLSTMVGKAQELSDIAEAGEGLDAKQDAEQIQKNAADTAVVTAELQGASKMFSMAQEASSTVLKSIGEGLSSMARKQ